LAQIWRAQPNKEQLKRALNFRPKNLRAARRNALAPKVKCNVKNTRTRGEIIFWRRARQKSERAQKI